MKPGSRDFLMNRMREVFELAPGSMPTLGMPVPAVPKTDAPVIYLDVNHWVALAKARTGHPDGARHVETYGWLREASSCGDVSVVIAHPMYAEVALAIRNVRQRGDLADVISEITRFRSLRPYRDLFEEQFTQALHDRFARPMFPRRYDHFGYGAGFAHSGKQMRASLVWPDGRRPAGASPEDLAEFEAMTLEVFDEVAEYLLLRGPSEEQAAVIENYSLDPVRVVEDLMVAREVELAVALEGDPDQRARIEDIVIARELLWEISPRLQELLWTAGMTVDGFLARGRDWLVDFLDSLPSLAVQKALKAKSFANRTREWSRNDQRDVAHMSVAVPYCDVVATDRHNVAVLNSSGLAKRLSTSVIATLDELPAAASSV